jgi:hypothetical protein
MKTLLLVPILWLTICGFAQAQVHSRHFVTGNSLYEDMRSSAPSPKAYASGYIIGVHDSLAYRRQVCIPDNKTPEGQVEDVVAKWLSENPAKRDAPGAIIVLVALSQAWPCPDKPESK